MKTLMWCLTCTLLVLVCTPTLAAVPPVSNYQGFLTDASGAPIDGTADIRVELWTGPSESPHSTVIYTELHAAVPVTQGLFNVRIGAGVPDDPGTVFDVEFFENNRWLEIEVNGETLSPRKQLASVPYAFRAESAERFDGVDPDAIDASQIANEAGADFTASRPMTLLYNFDVIMDSVTISAPSAGVIIVNSAGYFNISPDNTARCSLTTSSTIDSSYVTNARTNEGTVATIPFALTRGYSIGPGDITINLVCSAETDSPPQFVNKSVITAIFVPTRY